MILTVSLPLSLSSLLCFEDLLLGIDPRTLKPNAIRIADFGLTKKLEHGQHYTRSRCGTPKFMAPEIAHVPRDRRRYDNKVDVWSFGVIGALILSGQANIARKPIEPQRDNEPRRWIYLPRDMLPMLPPDNTHLKHLVADTLWDDPDMRPPFSLILLRLEGLLMIEFFGVGLRNILAARGHE
jgi:serine/threonine protein kinase